MTAKDAGWSRLPLIALLAFFISSIRLFIRFLYQAVPAFLGVYIAFRNQLHLLPYVITGLVLLLLVATFLRYRRFLWQFDEQRIRVKQGVFKVTELNLGYERIQQADIRKPIWLRPFKLTVLVLQSAGSKGKEVELPALQEETALLLQQRVLAKSEDASSADEVSGEVNQNSVANFEIQLENSEVWRIGVMQNVLIVVGALLAFVFANQTFSSYVTEQVELFVAGFDSTYEAVIVIVAIILMVLASIVALATLYYFNLFYGYHLQRHGERVHYRAGLLSSLSRSFRMPKLQLVDIRQGMVGRLLKRFSMRILQAGAINEKAEGRFTVPILNAQRFAALTNDLSFTAPTWQRVHIGFMFRLWLIAGVVATLALGWIAGVIAVVVVLLWRWVWWRRFGWHADQHWVAVRTAWIGQRQRWVPAAKMQRVAIKQAPWQRWLGCCNLLIDTAGGRLTIPWLRQAQADQLKQQLLDLTATNQRRWM